MWPWTTWPPSWSPTRSDGSTFTESPGSSAPSAVRESVSGTASNESRPSSFATTVRQTPATATESPMLAVAAVSGAETTSLKPSNASTLASSRTMPVNMRQRLRLAEVRLQKDVLSRWLRAEVEEVERSCQIAECVWAFPRNDWRDEEQQLVDEAGLEERRRE